MIKDLIKAFISATSKLFRHWRTTIVLFGLYFSLILGIYLFATTGQATIFQVLVTFFLIISIPVLFFLSQAMAVGYVQPETNLMPHLRNAINNFWKLLVVSIPIILLAWLAIYLFNKYQLEVPKVVPEAATKPAQRAAANTKPLAWKTIAVNTLWYLLFYLIFPLTLIQLWISTAKNGLVGTLKRLHKVFLRTFGFRSLFIYLVGLVFFLIIPRLLIFIQTSIDKWWVELGVLGLRLALAAMFIFFGWTLMLGTLSEVGNDNNVDLLKPEEPGNEPLPDDMNHAPA